MVTNNSICRTLRDNANTTLRTPTDHRDMMHHAMNQLCKVCGEPAAGFHFGAFTCEGCKSFFGRTYNNLSSLSECKNNGRCVINKKNRTSCKSCRLRKCLLVGMSKSGSRYGRRSNWFKIHCLLQDQAALHHHHHHLHHSLEDPAYNGFNSGGGKLGYESSEDTQRAEPKDDGDGGGSGGCGDDSSSDGGRLVSPYGVPSPSPPKRELTATATNAAAAAAMGSLLVHHQLPISPISPLSPLHPHTKFVFTPTCYLHNGKVAYHHPRTPYLVDPFHKKSQSPSTPPEQEDPMDLSVRGTPTPTTPTARHEIGDTDSDEGAVSEGSAEFEDDPAGECEGETQAKAPDTPLDLTTKTLDL